MITLIDNKQIRKGLTSIIPIITLLIMWEILSTLQVLNPALFSRPTLIIESLIQMFASGQLLTDISASLWRLVVSFFIASIIGVVVGLVIGASAKINRFVDPLITVLMPIPGIAWAPIFLVWLGFGENTLISVGAIAAFFPIVQNISAATSAVDEKMIWAAKTMGVNNINLFTQILLPNSFPYLFTGFKLGIARSWRTLIAVELIAGTLTGLGVMIFTAREYLQPYKIYGGIFVLAVTYFAIELVIRYIEKNTIEKWGMADVGVLHGI